MRSSAGRRDRTTPQHALNAETLYADLRHEPDPACAREREELGLLGKLTSHDCLIEIHSEPPGLKDLRASLAKHFTYWQEREREARGGEVDRDAPRLWIISSGMLRGLRSMLSFTRVEDWPAGIYQLGGEALGVGLVVATELPVDRTTLLVRLMAGGRLISPAVREVDGLPADDRVRVVAAPVLLKFEHVLQQVPDNELEEHEREFIMTVHKTWDDARNEALRQGREKGREEGREEGRTEERRRNLRRFLSLKFGETSPEVDARIARATAIELERFLDRLVVADSIAAVLAD